jgi:hypothetical protein
MSHYSLLGTVAKDVEDGGDDGTEGVPESDAGVGAAAREPCQRTQGTPANHDPIPILLANHVTTRRRNSEQ